MIAIGSDHAAYLFKEELKTYLLEKGYQVQISEHVGPSA